MSDERIESGNITASHGNNDAPRTPSTKHIRVPPRRPPAPAVAAEGGKGGEGGSRPTPAVTNREFLDAICSSVPEGAGVLALAKRGDPKDGGWIGFDACDVEARCNNDTNNYFNCASFYPADDGLLRAREAQVAGYHCLVLDDVGTKTPLHALPAVEPTWMLETSPGNFQVGFRLQTPVCDPAIVKAAQRRIFNAGLGDKGAGGIGRWMRLPNGVNGKAKYQSKAREPFRCRLLKWNPKIAYELEDLVCLLVPAAAEPVTEGRSAPEWLGPLAHPAISSEVFRPAQPENPVVRKLKDKGIYKRESSPGCHEVTCPWVEEHTDQIDHGACFFEPSRDHPFGGFKCQHSHGDKYRLVQFLEHFQLTRRDVHNKPRIRVIEGELQAMVDACQVVLADTGLFFQSGGLIKKVIVDPITGRAAAVLQNDADLMLALSSAADWERSEAKNGVAAWRRCNPHPTCIRLLTQAQTYAHLPALRAIARQPVIDEQGRLVSVAGYDPQSQLYCAFDPAKFARPEPTEAHARTALARLLHLLREFHFVGNRDMAAALSAIFTAVLRACLGRAPGYHFNAPSSGSGKSLLSDVTARFASPGEPPKVSFPRTEDEATKVVLAALIDGPAVIDFDDMSTDWRPFGAINRLLTSSTMTDRILGASKMATVSTDVLVLGSGNNTGPTGDLNRRVIVIDLDPGDENPATLRYEDDPLREIEANREAYVADVLLIVETWIAAGEPRANLCPIATYGGRWSDFCRQTLVWLGLEDPALGLFDQLKDDPDKAALSRLLRAWHAQLGEKSMTLRALLDAADGALLEAIEDLPFCEGGPINKSRFGHYLKRNAGCPVDGLKLEKAESRERNAWRVVSTVPPAQPRRSPLPPSPPLPPSLGPAPGADTETG